MAIKCGLPDKARLKHYDQNKIFYEKVPKMDDFLCSFVTVDILSHVHIINHCFAESWQV